MLYKPRSIVLLMVIILSLPTGCAVKKMTKQASQYEAAGMFKEASEMYLKALVKKPSKYDLKIATKRTAQLYYEDLTAVVKSSFKRGDFKATIYAYLEAEELISRVGRSGISIMPDPFIEKYFNDAKEYYFDERYTLGLLHITNQDYPEAKQVFSEIFKIDPDYKDTRIYLNEATFEPVYREGSRLFNEGSYISAYKKWESIFTHERNYKDVKDRMNLALTERYKEGTLYLMDEDFENAGSALGDVYRINPNLKDVKTQYTEARNEPVYRQASQELNQEKCRTAYFNFKHIIDDAGTYKDAKSLKDKALKCAQYPIAVYSHQINRSGSYSRLFDNLLIKNLVNENNIFLKVFALTSINKKVENRLNKNPGNIDSFSLGVLSTENNIKAIMIIEFDNYDVNNGKLKKDQKIGFERIVNESSDGVSKTYDKPIKYYEYYQENSISLSVRFKLISTSSGEILLSDSYRGNRKDKIKYATFGGDKNHVYPAKSISGSWHIDESGYRGLQNLLKSDTEIRPVKNLQNALFNELSQKIASDINDFNPE